MVSMIRDNDDNVAFTLTSKEGEGLFENCSTYKIKKTFEKYGVCISNNIVVRNISENTYDIFDKTQKKKYKARNSKDGKIEIYSAFKRLQKVLIAVVNIELDPIIDIEKFRNDHNFSEEEQWINEGPLLKVARKLFFPQDYKDARVYLLYTRLTSKGLRRKNDRISRGLDGPRTNFKEAEKRAELSETYLETHLGLNKMNVQLRPLDFDDENASSMAEWLNTLPKALKEIKAELSDDLRNSALYSHFEFHIVCMGAAQARSIFIGCCIGGLIKAKLWATPDPTKILKTFEGDFEYHIDADALYISPFEQEEKIAQENLLAIFKYINEIRVYIGGSLVNLGVSKNNPKASILYEVAKKWKMASVGISRDNFDITDTHGISVDKNRLSHMRVEINKKIKTHTEKLLKEGMLNTVIEKIIKAKNGDWSLDIASNDVHVSPL